MNPNTKTKPRAGTADCSKLNTSTDALVGRAKRGDARALEALLEEARPRAMAVAMKVLRNPTDAEDAVQDALLKVWRYLPRFEGRASFFTWIHRIVMNASLDALRRARSRADLGEDGQAGQDGETGSPEPSHAETPEVLVERAENAALVRSAMEALSDVHREAIQKREIEEYSYDEIAASSHCPVGTVMSRLHHARRRLGEEIRSTLAADDMFFDAA